MGALHEGHLSLVRRARAENDVVVVSVFVNPIQFNNKEDLAKYPRTVEQDCKLLAEAGADVAFVPSVEEMYPEPVNTVYHFGPLEEVMEGPRRPGHFSGVAVVVRRLFDLAQPTRAYFGEKDFQQIAIIRNLLEQIQYPIELVPCPIVRADDGLALSSRNMRLSKEAREVAPNIYATLVQAVEMSEYEDVESVKLWVMDTLSTFHEAQLVPRGERTGREPPFRARIFRDSERRHPPAYRGLGRQRRRGGLHCRMAGRRTPYRRHTLPPRRGGVIASPSPTLF